ncbi:MAG: PAS domain S-box protein, partial [Bacteroidales bacterium]|nr:PAS domain S-box protein [Bacteroidales bacterium]
MNTQKLNLLILEDNPDHAELIVRELEKEGFVLEWKRVETEKAFKKALAENPDIILSDYNLPSFNGMDAIKIHQELTPEIPLIIVSDMMSGDLAVECIKAGATDYVHKKQLSRLNPVVKRALNEVEACSERKKAEESLKESEKKYRTLFESSRDAIMMLAPPNWEFIAGNRATVEMFKARDEKEFASKGPGEISPEYQPDGQLSNEKALKMIKMAMKTGSFFFEWTHKRSNGEEFPATVLLTRIELKGKKLLQATVRDITERKQAVQELTKHREHLKEMVKERTSELWESEKKYRTLTENVNVGVFRNTVGSKGKFIEINPALIRIFGYKYKKEIFKLNASDLYQNPEERKKFNRQMLENGFVKDYELNLIKKDGSTLFGSVSAVAVKDKNGNVKFYDGIIDDI